jgi:two-component system OmpR family response regulator
MKLLVVEDDVETAAALLRDLTNFGHSVVVARDGRDAIFFAGAENFDAVVLDRMLPLVDGVHVMKRLRNGANVVPILMLSALGDLAHRLEGLEGGADDYLVKPAEPAEINARLHALIRRSKNEFRILRELVANVGQVVTRTMLLEAVWGYHFDPESNIVDAHIHKLRQQLRSIGSENLISTIRRSGYIIHDG